MSPAAPVGGGRRPSRRWDDFRVRVTADVISSIQMVNIENVREFVPILFAARSLSQPVNSEITKIHQIHEAVLIEKYEQNLDSQNTRCARVRERRFGGDLLSLRDSSGVALSPLFGNTLNEKISRCAFL